MTRKTTASALALAASLALVMTACNSDKAPMADAQDTEVVAAPIKHPLPGDPVAGKEIYEKKGCLACHGADGKGNGGITGANFISDKTRLAKSNAELLHSVREGIVGKSVSMPPQKDLMSDKEINDALAYIRQTFGEK